MKYLITGGLGFIGSNLALRLLWDAHKVVILDNGLTSGDNETALTRAGASVIYGDITDYNAWRRVLHYHKDIDFVFNLASPASPVDYENHPVETLRAGSLGVFNLVKFCSKNDVGALHASTSEVYGSPLHHPQVETYWGNVNPIGERSMYDESKRFAEAVIADSNRRGVAVVRLARIFNTYGPRMRHDDGRAVPNFIYRALHGSPLCLYGGGAQTRSLCYINDTMEALLTISRQQCTEPYNVGNPEEVSMGNLAEMIIRKCGSASKIERTTPKPDDPFVRKPDIRRMNALGWKPSVSLSEGLDLTIKWFSERYHVPARK